MAADRARDPGDTADPDVPDGSDSVTPTAATSACAATSGSGATSASGAASGSGSGSAGEPLRSSFVLHEHNRPRHHFDLRLEQDGVLRSWAVPRGLPTSPGQNRLAVQVPDHELAHLTYTDADKSIADIGWWEENDRNDRRFVFTLHGTGPSRRYALIRTSQDWLVHLTKDQPPT